MTWHRAAVGTLAACMTSACSSSSPSGSCPTSFAPVTTALDHRDNGTALLTGDRAFCVASATAEVVVWRDGGFANEGRMDVVLWQFPLGSCPIACTSVVSQETSLVQIDLPVLLGPGTYAIGLVDSTGPAGQILTQGRNPVPDAGVLSVFVTYYQGVPNEGGGLFDLGPWTEFFSTAAVSGQLTLYESTEASLRGSCERERDDQDGGLSHQTGSFDAPTCLLALG